jgi:hypothetical protein
MSRTIVIILLVLMETVTVAADAEWEMSEFAILLGWASHGDHPDDEAKMAAIAQAGFNTVMWYDQSPGVMDLSHQYGLKQLIQVKPPGRINDSHRHHLANWGYYVGDEPPPSGYPAVAAEVDFIHQIDPNHPAYVNITGTSDVAAFLDAVPVKVLSYTGIYKWWWYNTPYYESMEDSRTAGLDAEIPVMRWIEVNANPDVHTIEVNNQGQWPPWSVTAPPPPDNAEKLRQSVYSSLAYGVKGIQWFTGAILFEHGTSNLNASGTDVATLNWELQQLGPTLIGLESVDVFHTTPLPIKSFDAVRELPGDYWVHTDTSDLILGMFKDSQDNDYIMLNNRKIDESRQPVLSFPQDTTRVAQFDRGQGKWIDLPVAPLRDRAVVEFTLAPGDGGLLRVVPDDTAVTINSAITQDTTLISHESPDCCEDHNFGNYRRMDEDANHFVLGFDKRLAGGFSTEDDARPILKAGNVVTDLVNAGVTASSEILSAHLHLFRVQPETYDRIGRAYRLTTGGWVEGTGEFSIVDDATSWNYVIHDEVPWTTPGGDFDPTELGSFSTTAGDPTHTEYAVPITAAVKHWFDNASENFGVIVLRDAEDDDTMAFFASREDTVDGAAYVPYVSVRFAAPSTEFTWNTTNVGDWADKGNWTFSTGSAPDPDIRANSPNHTAIFADAISGPTTVSNHAAVTVNRIEFNNTEHSYVVAGQGSVSLGATDTPCLSCPSVSVTGTHQFQTVVNLLADSTINVASGSTLSFNNALELMGNTLIKIGDGTMAINNKLTTAGGTVDVQQGMISGNGSIAGDVDNGGTISPGNSPGVLVIEGDLRQGEGGSILIELSGTAAGSQYDILQVDGRLSADGTLEVSLLDGFQPSLSDTFDILDFGSLSGGFDRVILPDLVGTLGWDDSSLLVDGSISVVPEPTTIIPLCLGLMIWLAYSRQNSAVITWPSAMAASRCQVTNSIVSPTKVTCPSPKTTFTPPGCRLRAAA